jgi:hypothetical protein
VDRPFTDQAEGLVAAGVEDLQIAFASDVNGDNNPANYVWSNGMSPVYPSNALGTASAANLRAVRVSLVVRATREMVNSEGSFLKTLDTTRPAVENRAAATSADGFRRVVISRIVELPNLAPGSL